MKDWFLGLEPRERLLVAGGALVLVLLLLYVLIVEPLTSRYASLREGVAEQRKTLVWMQQAAREVQTLKRSAPGAARGLGGRSLLAVADQSARTAGLGDAIKRIEPDGGKGVKVWLEGVAFDAMILWLGKLTKTYQIQTSLITIEPQGSGRVHARLTLLEPGA
jgi:general secretion pathway protein M